MDNVDNSVDNWKHCYSKDELFTYIFWQLFYGNNIFFIKEISPNTDKIIYVVWIINFERLFFPNLLRPAATAKYPVPNLFFFFLFLFLLYFTLQYCIGFAIHWHESATSVHEFPIMNRDFFLRWKFNIRFEGHSWPIQEITV